MMNAISRISERIWSVFADLKNSEKLKLNTMKHQNKILQHKVHKVYE